ncbi:MAG: O-succinylhomoserine sulfhydrylase [Burkholderiaceae bacterium]
MSTSSRSGPPAQWHPETLAIRTGLARTAYQEHSEPLFLTSSFVFENAAQAAARFGNTEAGFMYSRAGNPTVAAFQQRLAALEGAESCVGAASGMAAIVASIMSLCSAGDHLVAAREVFGATMQLFGILRRFGIETTTVPLTDAQAWRDAMRPNTKLLFVESPSNPLTQVADIGALSEIAHAQGARLIVDNCFCSPAVQRPLALGADLVVHSATKYLDGQGRVLGGAVVGDRATVDDLVLPFLRTTGGVLSPFNAWVVLKGMETLNIRMAEHGRQAMQLAQWLREHPAVSRVHYPGLADHPQHALAMRQQRSGGPLLSFEVVGEGEAGQRANAWRLIDACQMISITANLGDVRSTITHPASTTHARVDAQARREAGLRESLVRLAVGLENPLDIQADLASGPRAVGLSGTGAQAWHDPERFYALIGDQACRDCPSRSRDWPRCLPWYLPRRHRSWPQDRPRSSAPVFGK